MEKFLFGTLESFFAYSLRGVRLSEACSHQWFRWKGKFSSKPEVFWQNTPVIGQRKGWKIRQENSTYALW